MSATGEQQQRQDLARENERLRARIAELENELVEQAARAATAVADAQEKSYWLERWHWDLDAFATHPVIERLRAIVRFGLHRYRDARARLRIWKQRYFR